MRLGCVDRTHYLTFKVQQLFAFLRLGIVFITLIGNILDLKNLI